MGKSGTKASGPVVTMTKPPVYETGWFEVMVGGTILVAACWIGLSLGSWNQPVELEIAHHMLQRFDHQTWQALGATPLYPLMLAGWLKVMGYLPTPPENPVRYFHLVLYVSAVMLSWRYMSHHLERPWRYVVTALFALSPGVLVGGSGSLLVYYVFSLGTLGLAGRFFSKGARTARVNGQSITVPAPPNVPLRKKLAVGTMLVLSALAHPAGYVLLAAMLPVAIRRMRFQAGLLYVATLMLALVPFWVIFVLGSPTLPTLAFNVPSLPQLQAMSETITSQLFRAVTAPLTLDPAALPWLPLSATGLVLLGLGIGFSKRAGLGSIYLSIYLLLLLFLEETLASLDMKTMMPLIPVLLLYFYTGLATLGQWFAKIKLPVGRVAGPATVILMLAGMLAPYQQLLLPAASPGTQPVKPAAVTSARTVEAWLKANVSVEDKVYVPRPESATHRAMAMDGNSAGRNTGNASLMQCLMASDFVVEDAASPASDLSKAIRQFQQHFRLVYNNGSEQIRIWEVRH